MKLDSPDNYKITSDGDRFFVGKNCSVPVVEIVAVEKTKTEKVQMVTCSFIFKPKIIVREKKGEKFTAYEERKTNETIDYIEYRIDPMLRSHYDSDKDIRAWLSATTDIKHKWATKQVSETSYNEYMYKPGKYPIMTKTFVILPYFDSCLAAKAYIEDLVDRNNKAIRESELQAKELTEVSC